MRDGRDAYERARSFRPDLIITDIQLPHVTGLDLIVQMRADPDLAAVPIMAVTAYAGLGDEARIRAAFDPKGVFETGRFLDNRHAD